MTPNLQFIVYDRAREAARITWYGRRLVIGRRIDADIRVNEPTMSGIHAEIVPGTEGGVRIRDLQSLNGTQLNGVRVVESVVQIGDQIQIGRARIVVGSPDSGVVRRPDQHDTDTSIELGSQTLKIRLDRLREGRAEILEEDRRLVLMRDLSEALKGVEDSQAALDKTRDVLEQAFPRARAFIVVRDETGAWRNLYPDPGARRPSMTFVEETVASNSAILSTSLPDDQRFSASESARISGIETAMAAPTSREGHPVAVLYLDRLGLPAFSRQDLHILGITANHVSAVLDNVARIAALRLANQELLVARENLANMNRNLEKLVEERTTEIRRQAEEIQRLAQDKDELLGIAAHDIRGPLTVIQGSSELLRLRFEELDPQILKRTLELMHGAARGLSKLLSELLDAKAIETGKITLHRRRGAARPAARVGPGDRPAGRRVEEHPAGGGGERQRHHLRRSRAARPGDHQPGAQRGQILRAPHPDRAARRRATPAAGATDRDRRRRGGHSGRGARPPLRQIRAGQGRPRGRRQRARADDRPPAGRAARRRADGREPGRRRHLLPAGRALPRPDLAI